MFGRHRKRRHHSEVSALYLQGAHDKEKSSENGSSLHPPEGCEENSTVALPQNEMTIDKFLAQPCSGKAEHYEKDSSIQLSEVDNNPFRRPGESDIVCVAHGNIR